MSRNAAHGMSVDGIMPWNRDDARAVGHHDVLPLNFGNASDDQRVGAGGGGVNAANDRLGRPDFDSGAGREHSGWHLRPRWFRPRPVVHLEQLEFPEPSNAMGRHPSVGCPASRPLSIIPQSLNPL